MTPYVHISLAEDAMRGYSSISLMSYKGDGEETHFPAPIPLRPGEITSVKLPNASVKFHGGGSMGVNPKGPEGPLGMPYWLSLSFKLGTPYPEMGPGSTRLGLTYLIIERKHGHMYTTESLIGNIASSVRDMNREAATVLTAFDKTPTPFQDTPGAHFDLNFSIRSVIPPLDNMNSLGWFD
jgi:hypothetical protein